MGTAVLFKTEEGCGNNRSVMPSDVPGCTRATMISAVRILQYKKKQMFQSCIQLSGCLCADVCKGVFREKYVINSKY